MSFAKSLGLMLYVDDVAKEYDFWKAVGFEIVSEGEKMGFQTFDMKPHPESTITFTVYDKAFIRQVSPEVIDMAPSILFESNDLASIHARVKEVAPTCSDLMDQPFPNFHFASPSGNFFAVKGI